LRSSVERSGVIGTAADVFMVLGEVELGCSSRGIRSRPLWRIDFTER
jgi:hypothetical protein